MSALIKQGSGAVRRSFALAPMPETPPEARDPELARLEKEAARLRDALAAAKTAEPKAREQGRQAGLAEAADREEERLDLVRDALAEAAARFDAQLARLEGLAPLLARAALEKLFDPAADRAGMAEAMIARQLRALRGGAAVTLSVSPEDFDADALAALGGDRIAAALDPDLCAGAARIACGLDTIDLDLREQWAALAALLDAMTAEAA